MNERLPRIDGGPAFPRPPATIDIWVDGEAVPHHETHEGHEGMTLLDWFAGQALAAGTDVDQCYERAAQVLRHRPTETS